MKKWISFFGFAILLFLLMSGCDRTTITEKPGNHLYQAGDEIHMIDIDSRETLGTLTIVDTSLLKDEPFMVRKEVHAQKEASGAEGLGYEEAEYQQLVQIYYTYDNHGSGKTLSELNFRAYDDSGQIAEINPDTQYERQDREGTQSFEAALCSRSDRIEINFGYSILQLRPTARIELFLTENQGKVINEEFSDVSSGKESSAVSSEVSRAQVERRETSAGWINSVDAGQSEDSFEGRAGLLFQTGIIFILLLVILVLAVVVVVLLCTRKR